MKKTPLKIVLAYGTAAIGYNFVYAGAASFLQLFYTNVVGISLAAVGTIMLTARIWDGINDPFMGSIIDRSRLPGGRYRPFIKIGILPLSIIFVLLFWFPDVNTAGKIVYAVLTYNLFGMAYTLANIPYMAMQATLSTDPDERTKIITIKNGFTIAGLMGAMILIPQLAITADGPTASGFFRVGILGGIIVCVTMIITWLGTKKSSDQNNPAEAGKITWKERFLAITGNKPLILMSLTLLIFSVTQALVVAASYYFINILGKPELVKIWSMTLPVSMVIAMALMPFIIKMEKKNAMTAGMVVYGLFSVVLYLLPVSRMNLFLIVNGIRGIGLGIVMILVWSMIADSVDFAQLRTGKHQGGIVFSTSTFVQKAASGIGAALINGLLILVGFQPDAQVQTTLAGEGIKAIITIVPGIVLLINALLVWFFYPLTKVRMKEIANELEQANR